MVDQKGRVTKFPAPASAHTMATASDSAYFGPVLASMVLMAVGLGLVPAARAAYPG
jgi:hypothetical protein